MDLRGDPAAFGTSIVFDRDWDEEEAFSARNMCEGKFCSPDKLNAGNLAHGRLKRLKAADVVDSPAANPDGLFPKSRRLAIAESFSSLASYALGLSSTAPATSSLGAHPDSVREFVSRFLESNQLSIVKKEPAMPQSEQTPPKPADPKPPKAPLRRRLPSRSRPRRLPLLRLRRRPPFRRRRSPPR